MLFEEKFNDVLEECISDMKKLQSGILIITRNKQVWVSAGLGMVTADLPQGNDMAGIKDIMQNTDVALARSLKANCLTLILTYFKMAVTTI